LILILDNQDDRDARAFGYVNGRARGGFPALPE
jgi:hypothetical protein